MPFGYMETSLIDFPANVDVAYIQGLENREGVTFQRILSELDTRLNALNTSLDPLLGDLLSTTTEPTIDDTAATAFRIRKRTEKTVDRPQTTDISAHMLPIDGYDVSLGFTEDFLMAATFRRIETQMDSVLNGFRQLYRHEALVRFFSIAEVSVDKKTAAISPGFAGSGTGNNAFVTPYPNGTALPGGYTQYYRAATSARDVTIKAMRDQLALWNDGPFDMIGTSTAIAAVQLLPDFVPAGSVLIRPGQNTAEALVDPDIYLGVYAGNIRVRKPLLEVQGDYLAVFKTSGNLSSANPLVWRYDPKKGRRAWVRYRSLFPLDQAVVLQDFGIGASNLVAAALAKFAGSGNYTDPVIN